MATLAVLMIVMASLVIVRGVKKVVMVKVIKKSSNKLSPPASSDKSHRQDVHHCIARSALEAASPRDKPFQVGG